MLLCLGLFVNIGVCKIYINIIFLKKNFLEIIVIIVEIWMECYKGYGVILWIKM